MAEPTIPIIGFDVGSFGQATGPGTLDRVDVKGQPGPIERCGGCGGQGEEISGRLPEEPVVCECCDGQGFLPRGSACMCHGTMSDDEWAASMERQFTLFPQTSHLPF